MRKKLIKKLIVLDDSKNKIIDARSVVKFYVKIDKLAF